MPIIAVLARNDVVTPTETTAAAFRSLAGSGELSRVTARLFPNVARALCRQCGGAGHRWLCAGAGIPRDSGGVDQGSVVAIGASVYRGGGQSRSDGATNPSSSSTSRSACRRPNFRIRVVRENSTRKRSWPSRPTTS